MMRVWILAAVLSMIAASAIAQPMPAPTPEDVAVRVTADQNGQNVEAAVGDSVAIELQNSPSTGSSWRVASKPAFLADPEQLSGPTSQPAASGRPMMGAPRWQVFVFPVAEAGEGVLTLEKVGPGAAGVLESFSLTVTAQ